MARALYQEGVAPSGRKLYEDPALPPKPESMLEQNEQVCEELAVIQDCEFDTEDHTGEVIIRFNAAQEGLGALQIIREQDVLAFLKEWGTPRQLSALNGKVCVVRNGRLSHTMLYVRRPNLSGTQ